MPTGMIDYAILGLLREQPDHGYRLRQRLLQRLGPVWDINPGQVYLVLHGLRRCGFAEVVVEDPPDPLGRRLRFAITARGERELARWLKRAPRTWCASRRELELVLLLMHDRSPTEFDAYLAAMLAAAEATAASLHHDNPDGRTDIVRTLSVRRALDEVTAIQGWIRQVRTAVAGTRTGGCRAVNGTR